MEEMPPASPIDPKMDKKSLAMEYARLHLKSTKEELSLGEKERMEAIANATGMSHDELVETAKLTFTIAKNTK